MAMRLQAALVLLGVKKNECGRSWAVNDMRLLSGRPLNPGCGREILRFSSVFDKEYGQEGGRY